VDEETEALVATALRISEENGEEADGIIIQLCLSLRRAWDMASRCETAIHDTVKELEDIGKIAKSGLKRLDEAGIR
jgi:hypothetical protein